MEIWPTLTPGYLFLLDRSAASKIIYVRPVGGPENTSNIGENPNIKQFGVPPLGPHPNSPREFLICTIIYGTYLADWKAKIANTIVCICLHLEIRQFCPHFGVTCLLNYTDNMESREKINWRKFPNPSGAIPPKLQNSAPCHGRTVGSFLLTAKHFFLQLTILAFLLTIGAFLLTTLPFLLTIGAFFSGTYKVLIFLRIWCFYSHALWILSADDFGDFSGIL